MEMLDNNLEITAKQNSVDNILLMQEMEKKIENLINIQKNLARIAQKIDVRYHALNNCFAIKKEMEELSNRLENIDELINKEDLNEEELKRLSDIILKVSTLMNYLNNPKSKVPGLKLDRFGEMSIIEENELKRQIWTKIIRLKTGAELRSLEADEEDIENATFFEKVIGVFTGKKKIDEIKKEQIEFKRKEVKKVFNEEWGIDKNYSIHEMIAIIDMFLEDNKKNLDLLEDEINDIQRINSELHENFVIKEEKVKSIVNEKENKLLPVDTKKISKREQLEIESYRFLSKNGYDILEEQKEENGTYADTMANEIRRITDYIDVSL